MTAQRSILFFLLALALVRGLIYASIVPPWQAPDEPAQFERARAALTATEWNSTSENGPPWYDDLIRSLFAFNHWDFLPTARQTYAPGALLNQYLVPYQEAYSGLYGSRPTYAAMGWPLFLARHRDITLQLYLVRAGTVLMNVGIVFFAFLITRTIFPKDAFLIFGVPILILFNPQHTHLLSTVNNGNLAELLTVIALYFMVKVIIMGVSWLSVLAILLFSLVAMWTKATAYFLPFAIGTIGLFYLWQYRRYWRWLLPTGMVVVGTAYIFSPERLSILLLAGWDNFRAGNLYLDPIVPLVLFRSFWAVPGWLTLQLHPFWYQVLAISCILAVIGLIVPVITKWRLLFSQQYRSQIQALVLLAVAAIVAIGVLLGWNAVTNSIIYRQGRSIYPVIVPLTIFLMLGWRQLIPANWRDVGLLAITGALFLFDSLVLFNYIIPFFYSRY